MGEKRIDILQRTLALMVLKTLFAKGPMHRFGIANRLEQISNSVPQSNEGAVYRSLLHLQQTGLDRFKTGKPGEQSHRALSLNHRAWATTTGARDGELGARCGRDRTRSARRKAGLIEW